jgi:Tfp pilus assembly PilM family ATPase
MKEADFTFTADWWDLYTNKKGVKSIAKNISRNLNFYCSQASMQMSKDIFFTAKDAAHQVMQDMEKVLIRYAQYGAYDTEPRAQLKSFINYKFNTNIY